MSWSKERLEELLEISDKGWDKSNERIRELEAQLETTQTECSLWKNSAEIRQRVHTDFVKVRDERDTLAKRTPNIGEYYSPDDDPRWLDKRCMESDDPYGNQTRSFIWKRLE